MNSEQPLKCDVIKGRLVISIGIKTLAWASHSENGGPEGLESADRGGQTCRVDDNKAKFWARDVASEMKKEDETGATMLSDFIDKAMIAAADNGSEALIFSK